MIVQAETEDAQDMNLAKDIAEILHEYYPGHLWAVTVKGGIAMIKDLYISSLWGYVLKYKDIVGDAGARKKAVMRAGGEILERAKLERGPRQLGQEVIAVDGIKNYNPMGVR